MLKVLLAYITRKYWSNYLANCQGNITVMVALAAIPLLGAAGLTIDYARVSRVEGEIQVVADSAALAAASATTVSASSEQGNAQRIAIAKSFLSSNLAHLSDAKVAGEPVISVTGSTVLITLRAKVNGSFMNVMAYGESDDAKTEAGSGGQEAVSVSRDYNVLVLSKAGWTAGKNYICLLALNPTQSQSLHVKGTADIKSSDCTVQVNSSSNSGLYQNGNATLTAASICVTGNANGSNFSPTPKIGTKKCPAIADPLAASFGNSSSSDHAKAYAAANVLYNKTVQLTFNAGTTTIDPGRYVGGIRVTNNREVILKPGIYVIENGEFEVQAGGVVKGLDGVTIVLTGNSTTRLNVQAGGSLYLKASAAGCFAGIAIAQHPNTLPSASKENSIIGGGTVELEGIIYFPKQRLNITGNGWISKNAKQFAIVADRIHVEGNGQLNIGQAANYSSAGLPALPSSAGSGVEVTLQ